jgi:hypothetical protein
MFSTKILIDIKSYNDSIALKKNLGFRGWYYFRQGWSMYFAFLFSAVNTLTVTYYLAIEKAPALKSVFPSFIQYVVIITAVGIPILVLLGYLHFKRTSAYASEANVVIESNPYQRRSIVNTELLVKIDMHLLSLLTKLIKNEKLQDKEITELSKIQEELSNYIQQRTLDDGKDLKFLKNIGNLQKTKVDQT